MLDPHAHAFARPKMLHERPIREHVPLVPFEVLSEDEDDDGGPSAGPAPVATFTLLAHRPIRAPTRSTDADEDVGFSVA